MSIPEQRRRQIADVILRAKSDDALKARLLTNPVATLQAEGISLSDAELAGVAGGGDFKEHRDDHLTDFYKPERELLRILRKELG